MAAKISTTVGPVERTQFFAQDRDTTTGTTFGYKSGRFLNTPTGVLTSISAGTIALAEGTNIVHIDFGATPVIAASLSTSLPIRLESVFLFIVEVAGGTITSVLDLRSWATSITQPS